MLIGLNEVSKMQRSASSFFVSASEKPSFSYMLRYGLPLNSRSCAKYESRFFSIRPLFKKSLLFAFESLYAFIVPLKYFNRWDSLKRKKPRFLAPLLFLFSFVLTVAVFFWRDSLKVFPVSLSAVSSPLPVVVPSYLPPSSVLSVSVPVKQSSVVRSVLGGYQGYVEVNGVRKEIYSPAIVSETYRYKSVSDVKFLPIKINGIEFDAMIDTGASVVSVNSAVVRLLGVKEFTDKKLHNTAAGSVWAYYFPCSISLGSFEVSNIQCSYNPEAHDILLGGSFLKNFNYSVDESAETITFALK